MTTKLLQFEWQYHTRQTSFILFLILFIGYGVLAITQAFQYLEFSSMYNDAYNLSFLSGIISIGVVFASIFFCVNGLLRDTTFHSKEIIFSTGIQKHSFLINRFLGLFLVSLLIGSSGLIGVFIGTNIAHQNPEALHHFNISHYLWPWLTIIVPNAFICTAILFSATLLSQKAIVTYIIGLLLIAIHWISGFYINSPLVGGSILSDPEILEIASLVDPIGLSAFFEQTQFLTPIEKNETLISLSGHFVWNRVIWIFFSVVSIVVSYRLFYFRKLNQKVKKQVISIEDTTSNSTYTPVTTISDTLAARIARIRSIVVLDTKMIITGIPFLIIILLWIAMIVLAFNNSVRSFGIYGNRYPTTDLFIGLIHEILPIMGLLLIVFYTGEMVWKSRSNKFHEIIEGTPTKNSTFFISKYITIAIIPILLILISIFVAITFQLSNGYYDIELTHYFSMFYFGGLQVLLYTIFALLIQNIVSNKYLGMVISGGIMLLFGPLSNSIGLEHPLVLFNNLPSMARTYSDFNAYGQYVVKFNWLSLYWITFAGIIALFGFKLWKRGTISTIRTYTRMIWSKKERVLLISFVFLFVTIGSYIYYNTNMINEYEIADEAYDFNEKYERAYKKYDHLAVPKLISVQTAVDIFPNQHKYEVKASCLITNTGTEPIKEIFITTPIPLKKLSIENSIQVFHDSIIGTYLFKLHTPLLQGSILKMEYNLTKSSSGFDIDHSITNNGSYIKSHQFSPHLGYVNQYEINYTYEREKRGLPVREKPVVNDNYLQIGGKFNFENIDFEAVVSTSNDQSVLCSGDLIKQWKSNDRNYYHYKSKGKINSMVAYHSARYKIEKTNHKGIQIELYYLPEHYRNIAEMIKVTKATIDYATDNFGKYPHKHLRIGEMSIFGGGGANGQAMPGVISINEKVFKRDVSNPEDFNVIARVIIHEIAHQWWGGLLTPKRIDGFMVLSESLAKYSETVIMEKLYGKAMVRQLSEHTVKRYFSGRSHATEIEPSLYLSQLQQYLGYSKGATVMSAIKDLIGESNVNLVLQNMISKYGHKPTATTLDFLEELYLVTPIKYHNLIDDWMKRVITYDLRIKSTSYKKLSNGTYEITVGIKAQRFETDSSGKEITININEPIKIGIFKKHPETINNDKDILYLESHQINKTEMIFKIITKKIPAYIGIDPYYTRLDRNMADNIVSVNL
ncbi:ABC transporter permease/M1 family aminopeptidase [Aquimarina megaterium]|uniref:ABC transporter permease/M1 family aminopeptidase n=1 Tax=Aquimarina megaterium TaxID=1443666 RepID=UPI000945ABDF|nr:M1 family aminopeptidase [Aquimarina megaterium]